MATSRQFSYGNPSKAQHSHLADAHLHVAAGELQLGYGTSTREEDLVSYSAGSFLWVPARAVHFDGATIDTVIIGSVTGPWDTIYATST